MGGRNEGAHLLGATAGGPEAGAKGVEGESGGRLLQGATARGGERKKNPPEETRAARGSGNLGDNSGPLGPLVWGSEVEKTGKTGTCEARNGLGAYSRSPATRDAMRMFEAH